ncbi:hypothetical protein [Alkalispirochaeta sphaeroplastigenens]|uniref:hypothetical protein n=1 Tax=Alkalispirochaeta sphaeroplastigenens TaxID=1187066 RepID=UPI0011AF531B|nr:hypothetical protein [Alkalispirochaeta sphaeroplastigenens]
MPFSLAIKYLLRRERAAALAQTYAWRCKRTAGSAWKFYECFPALFLIKKIIFIPALIPSSRDNVIWFDHRSKTFKKDAEKLFGCVPKNRKISISRLILAALMRRAVTMRDISSFLGVVSFLYRIRFRYSLNEYGRIIEYLITSSYQNLAFRFLCPKIIFAKLDVGPRVMSLIAEGKAFGAEIWLGQISAGWDMTINTISDFLDADVVFYKSFFAYSVFGERFRYFDSSGKNEKIRLPRKEIKKIGILIHSKIDSDSLCRTAYELKEMFPSAEFLLRPHPFHVKDGKINLKVPEFCLIDFSSTLDDLSKVDFAISSQTTASADVLLRGCPVVEVGELNHSGRPESIWVSQELMLGVHKIKDFSISQLISFYIDEMYSSRVSLPPEELHVSDSELKKIVSYLNV